MLHPKNFHPYLRWPAGVSRTETPSTSKSKKSFYEGLVTLEQTMSKAGIKQYDIYAKVDFDFSLKRVVEIYDDTAVVVKWKSRNGDTIAYACDHYLSLSRNLQEICKAIELRSKIHRLHFQARVCNP